MHSGKFKLRSTINLKFKLNLDWQGLGVSRKSIDNLNPTASYFDFCVRDEPRHFTTTVKYDDKVLAAGVCRPFNSK